MTNADRMEILETRTRDGRNLFYRHFPVERPLGAAVFLHGIQSHSGWYEASAGHLQKGGIEVFSLDRRGSGLNQDGRGDVNDWKVLVEDVAEFVCSRVAESGFRRVHLAGISWGGILASVFSILHPELLSSLTLVALGISPKVGLSARENLSVFWNALFSPLRKFPIPIDRPEMFTANPDRIAYIREDPLSLHHSTARFLFESFRMDRFLKRHRHDIRVPLLLLLAGHDEISDNRRLEEFFMSVASAEKRIRLFPKAHHTLEFEPDPEPVFREMLEWIRQHRAA